MGNLISMVLAYNELKQYRQRRKKFFLTKKKYYDQKSFLASSIISPEST